MYIYIYIYSYADTPVYTNAYIYIYGYPLLSVSPKNEGWYIAHYFIDESLNSYQI